LRPCGWSRAGCGPDVASRGDGPRSLTFTANYPWSACGRSACDGTVRADLILKPADSLNSTALRPSVVLAELSVAPADKFCHPNSVIRHPNSVHHGGIR
jgi:hypothetical protein